jgi:hypothetical protein
VSHPADINHMLIWVAVKGLSPSQALAALGLELSDDEEARDVAGWPNFLERHDYQDRIFMGRLPRNWLLLFGNLDEEEKDTLAELAEFGPAFLGNISRIGCFAEGHGYVDGEEAWSVDYDYESRKPADALRVDGQLPPKLAAIIEQARAAEAKGQGSDIGIDLFFEIPGKMSKALCGFGPHEEPPSGFRWSMLQRIGSEPAPKSRPKGFLARLFGGR